MSDPAIRAVSLGKVYRVWRHPSDMLKEAVTGRRRHSEFEALRDISFEVPKGSVVGVLGRNGAGKSTLLRIIAGTLDATSGSVAVAGRISAILELGTGFHPDYSGRENVFLGGLCLGLTRAEVASRLDEIVSFAELEEFIDQPFRTYSSGMQARLTFAVATAVDPDVLIVDEALSVGDARFQLKSFDRLRQFRRQGKSILLVSHSIDQVVSICDHAILLERGSVFAKGEPGVVGNVYHELLFGPRQTTMASPPPPLDASTTTLSRHTRQTSTIAAILPGAEHSAPALTAEHPARSDADSSGPTNNSSIAPSRTARAVDSGDTETRENRATETPSQPATNVELESSRREHRYGDGVVRIVDFFLRAAGGARISRITSLQPYEFVLHLQAVTDANKLGVGVLVRTPRGIEVFAANTFLLPEIPTQDMAAGDRLQVRVPFVANLGHGAYFASAVVANSDSVKHDARFDALEFTVERTCLHDASLANLDPWFIYENLLEIEMPVGDRTMVDTP
jgi:lipopolysaccharide transport system ATP-binding protein